MGLFPETASVIRSAPAGPRQEMGTHRTNEVSSGVRGRALIEVPYDPAQHSPSEIKPFSVMSLITGEDQVDLVRPYQPLSVNVVLHRDPKDDPYNLQAPKERLFRQLSAALPRSVTGLNDRARHYVVGEGPGHRRHRIIDIATDGSPEADAAAMAKICSRGLTFIISDFLNLPLEQAAKRDFRRTVGVKVDHQLEIALPGGEVVLPLAGVAEVATYDEAKLERANKALNAFHAATIGRLASVGVAVAQIAVQPALHDGVDYRAADRSIAAATQHVLARR